MRLYQKYPPPQKKIISYREPLKCLFGENNLIRKFTEKPNKAKGCSYHSLHLNAESIELPKMCFRWGGALEGTKIKYPSLYFADQMLRTSGFRIHVCIFYQYMVAAIHHGSIASRSNTFLLW